MKAYYWYFGLGALVAIATAIAVTDPANTRSANAQGVPVDTNRGGNVDLNVNRTGDREIDRNRNLRSGVRTDRKGLHRRSYKASELIGLNVRGKAGDDDIGEINDLMIDRNGRIVYAAVSFGGFLGIGDKLFAVPFGAIDLVRDADNDLYARIDVTEQTLEKKEGFDQENWPDAPSKTFRVNTAQRNADRLESSPNSSR